MNFILYIYVSSFTKLRAWFGLMPCSFLEQESLDHLNLIHQLVYLLVISNLTERTQRSTRLRLRTETGGCFWRFKSSFFICWCLFSHLKLKVFIIFVKWRVYVFLRYKTIDSFSAIVSTFFLIFLYLSGCDLSTKISWLYFLLRLFLEAPKLL